jgi:5-methyltetrahydrofolate--homocysteine methyltransferase
MGNIIIATVEGDIYDIGNDIVVLMLVVNGFEVHDIGIDAPTSQIVGETKEFQQEIVGLSGFLTQAFDSMKNTVDAIKHEGLASNLKIMFCQGQIDDTIREYFGAYGAEMFIAWLFQNNG